MATETSSFKQFLKTSGWICLGGLLLIEAIRVRPAHEDQHHPTQATLDPSVAAIAYPAANHYLPGYSLTTTGVALGESFTQLATRVARTKDGVLVVVPKFNLAGVSDAAKLFPNKVQADGSLRVSDLTFSELAQVSFDGELPYRASTLAQQVKVWLNGNLEQGPRFYPELLQPQTYLANSVDLAWETLELFKQFKVAPEQVVLQTQDAAEVDRLKDQVLPVFKGAKVLQVVTADALRPSLLDQTAGASLSLEQISKSKADGFALDEAVVLQLGFVPANAPETDAHDTHAGEQKAEQKDAKAEHGSKEHQAQAEQADAHQAPAQAEPVVSVYLNKVSQAVQATKKPVYVYLLTPGLEYKAATKLQQEFKLAGVFVGAPLK